MTASSSTSPPDRSADFQAFRETYGEFGFTGWKREGGDDCIKVRYQFTLNGEVAFEPTLSLPPLQNLSEDKLALLENVIFHVGLMELISYWKAYCPPQLTITCGALGTDQRKFLEDLIFNGLGEFRYLNGLTMPKEDFVPRITSEGPKFPVYNAGPSREECLVPLGGGKDSAVVLSLLKKRSWKLWPMFLNADPAAERVAGALDISEETWVPVRRTICPELIKRNQEGALNGHTPFSALLAFIASGYAALQGIRYVVLANESSANEATVPGTMINHQYSKSWHFEDQFSQYFREFVCGDTSYFSLLRPWNEAQIAREFAKYPALLDAFRSCNAGSKQDQWCGQCPKCLFVFVMLAGFVPLNRLTSVFGKNLLDDADLYPTLKALAGFDDAKPFECVGSMDEVVAALVLLKEQYPQSNLISRFFQEFEGKLEGRSSIDTLLGEFNMEHGLPADFEAVLPELEA